MLDGIFSTNWSAFNVAAAALAALTIYFVVASISKELKIRRLGGHAPVRRTYLPLGVSWL